MCFARMKIEREVHTISEKTSMKRVVHTFSEKTSMKRVMKFSQRKTNIFGESAVQKV